MAYRQTLNAFAYKQVTKPVHIPDYHLMVGSAENLNPLPIILSKQYVPSEVAIKQADLNKLSDEEIESAINNNLLEVNDFNINLLTLGI